MYTLNSLEILSRTSHSRPFKNVIYINQFRISFVKSQISLDFKELHVKRVTQFQNKKTWERKVENLFSNLPEFTAVSFVQILLT